MFAFLLAFALSSQARLPKKTVPQLKVPSNADSCSMCTSVVGYVEQLMNSTLVEKEIAALVSLACSALPSPVSYGCSFLVNSYLPLVIQYLEQGLEWLDICHKLGFCTDAQMLKYAPATPMRKARLPRANNALVIGKKADSCSMCTSVIGYVEQLMNSTLVEKEIAALVSLACSALPSPVSYGCSFLVNNYLPLVIQYLEQGLEWLDICHKLGFCTDLQVQHRARLPKLVRKSPRNDETTCLMCKKVIAYVEAAMEDEKIEEQIIEVVDKACALFPTTVQTLCVTIIKSSIPTIISWLEQGIEALDVCKLLNFCS